MPRQVPFTEHEAALLLDAYLKTLTGEQARMEAVRECSAKLRQMAVNAGVEIDEVYRNVNGISFQIASMESAYQGHTIMKPATRLFSEMVSLYHSDRQQYEKLLKEATVMAETKLNNENAFVAWLAKNVSEVQLSELYSAVREIEKQAKKVKLVRTSLFEKVDIALMKKIRANIETSRIFKFTHKRQWRRITLAMNYLVQFASQNGAYENKEEAALTIHPASKRDVPKSALQAEQIQIVAKPVQPEEPTQPENKKAEEAISSDAHYEMVNFLHSEAMAFTKPVSLSYFGETKPESSWKGLYVDACRYLLADYPKVFARLRQESMYETGKTWLVDETNLHLLAFPEKIEEDYFVETKRSASDLLKSLKWLLGECSVEYENVVIRFVRKEEQDTTLRAAANIEPSQKQYYSENKGMIIPRDVESLLERSSELSTDLTPYTTILVEHFPKGYRLESALDMKRMRRYYEELTGKTLEVNQEKLETAIRKCGIVYDGRLYMPQNMLSEEMKEQIFSFINRCFEEGRSAVYYEAVFREFSEELLDHNIFNADMLKAYLSYYVSDKYYIGKRYLSKEYDAAVDPADEVRQYLKQYNTPVQADEICDSLSHLAEKRVRQILRSYYEIVRNGKSEYFHADSLQLTEEELGNIASIIESAIEEHEFISGKEIYDAVKTKYPYTFEKNAAFSVIGWRDALKYKIGDRFSFGGNIISRAGTSLSVSDVFTEYGKRRSRFSLGELEQFADSIGSNIYFDALYTNSVRISQECFASKSDAHFSVKETDAVLERFCGGEYMPISAVTEFALFPEASFPWTEYLLEQYAAFFSEKFCLMHSNYNKNCAVGAIVRKTCQYSSFDDLVTDILAHSDIPLRKKEVLDFLAENGFISRRSCANIETLIINARAKRNQKEK